MATSAREFAVEFVGRVNRSLGASAGRASQAVDEVARATERQAVASRRAAQAQEQASARVERARAGEAAAARRVAIEEARLVEAKKKHAAGSAGLLQAEDRLERAREAQAEASRRATAEARKLADAQADVGRQSRAAAELQEQAARRSEGAARVWRRSGEKSGEEYRRGVESEISGPRMKGVFVKAVGALAALDLGRRLGSTFMDSIEQASRREQSQGGVSQVFQKEAAQIEKAAARSARAIGLSGNAYREYATVLGAGLKNKGIKDFTAQSQRLLELGADLSATYGGDVSEAVSAIGALMRGEADPIERYGVAINETAIKAELAAKGQTKLTGAALEQAKTQARLAILFRQTADAQGQFGREADTYAGKVAIVSAQWEDLKTKMGDIFLPVASDVMGVVDRVVTGLSGMGDQAGGLGKILESVKTDPKVSQAWSDMADRFGDLKKSATDLWPSVEKLVTGFFDKDDLMTTANEAVAGMAENMGLLSKAAADAGPEVQKIIDKFNNLTSEEATANQWDPGKMVNEWGKTLRAKLIEEFEKPEVNEWGKTLRAKLIEEFEKPDHSDPWTEYSNKAGRWLREGFTDMGKGGEDPVASAGAWLRGKLVEGFTTMGTGDDPIAGAGAWVRGKIGDAVKSMGTGEDPIASAGAWVRTKLIDAFTNLGTGEDPVAMAGVKVREWFTAGIWKGWDPGAWLGEKGKELRQAIIDGFTGMGTADDPVASLGARAREWFGGFITKAKEVLGIQSPSTVAAGMGRDFIAGWDLSKPGWVTSVQGWATTLSTAISDMKTKALEKFGELRTGATDILGDIDRKVRPLAAKPARFMIETVVNRGLIGAYDGLRKVLPGLPVINQVPLGDLARYEHGGRAHRVPGSRARGVDSTLGVLGDGTPFVRVDPGEGIVRRGAMRTLDSFHPGAFEYINSTGRLPGFFRGGILPTPGPVRPHRLPYYGAQYAADMGFGTGSPVYAWKDGRVAQTMLANTSYGNRIRLNHDPGQTLYAHLSQIAVVAGQIVRAGQLIGRIGYSGNVRPPGPGGAHLHFEILGGAAMMGGDNTGSAGFFDAVGDFAGKITAPLARLSELGDSPWAKAVAGFPPLVAEGMKAKIRDAAASFGFDAIAGAAGAVAGPKGAGVERWRGTVNQALGILGLPASLADTTLRRLNQESSGNPGAVNNWDSNARRGTPSKGLMQVIDPTFRAYAHPQYNRNVYDPLSNILASMRYAIARYGSLPAAYNRPGGYDSGGWLMPGLTTTYNGTGKPEAVLTNAQWTGLFARLDRVASVLEAAETEGGVIELHLDGDVIARIARSEIRSHAKARI